MLKEEEFQLAEQQLNVKPIQVHTDKTDDKHQFKRNLTGLMI